MVTVGKAIEGEVPNADDFLDAAVLVGGMHGAMKAGPKLRQMYAKTGEKPATIAAEALKNPVAQTDLVAESPTINPNPELTARETAPSAKDGAQAPPRTEATEKILSQIGEKKEAAAFRV